MHSELRTLMFDGRALSAKPIVGAVLVSPTGRKWSRIAEVTAVRQAGQKAGLCTYRMGVVPLRKAEAEDAGMIIRVRPRWRPSRAVAEPIEPVPQADRVSTLQAAKRAAFLAAAGQTKRIKTLLRDDRDRNRLVASVRTATILDHTGAVLREPTAEHSEWRDPDDLNPNRREARKIAGYRTADVFNTLALRSRLITRAHRKAVNRLRSDHEIGSGYGGGHDFEAGSDRSFGPTTGPQEHVCKAAAAYEAAKAALEYSLFSVVEHVVLLNQHLRNYAAKHRVPEDYAMGMFVSALQRLSEHYDPPKRRHTIRD